MKFRKIVAVLACSAGSCVISAAPSFAQSTPAAAADAPGALDDIVVTARKREESLIRVPVAVSAFNRAVIERSNITDISRMVQITPGLKASSNQYGAAFVIRGIGSTTTDPGLEQSVALNIDGINAGRGLLGNLALFDTAQIEILKGPQALFFGKNSPAGVISVTSAGPGDVLSGYARAGYEFDARERFIEGAIGGPVTDTLGVRLAVRGTKMDGWLTNTAPPKANPFQPANPFPGAWSKRIPAKKNLLGRLTVQWKPTDKLDFTLKAFATRYRDNMSGAEQQAICTGPFPITFGVPDPDGDCKANGLQPISAAPAAIDATFPHAKGRPYTHFNAKLISLNVNYEMENVTLTSATGYYTLHNDSFAANFEASTIGYIDAYNGERTRYVTQELRAVSDFEGPINFSVGAYFEDGRRRAINDAQIAPVGADPVTGKFQSAERVARVRSKAYSLFGQLRWEIVPDLELAGGARWTKENKRLATSNTYAHSILRAVFLPVGTVISGSNKEDNVSPEVTLTWHPTTNSTLYGAFKTGYKSGGFANPPLLTAGFNSLRTVSFGKEKARGGEIGYKAELLDRSLRVEATAFRYTYKGLQLSSFDAATISYRIRNAAAARSQGFEVETNWRAADGLTLHAAVNYTKGRYTDFTTGPCYVGQTVAQGCVTGIQDLTGKQLDRSPDWSSNVSFNYDMPVSSDLSLAISGDAAYSGSYFTNQNHAPLSKQDNFWLFGAGLRLHSPTQGWELALLGRNLTNKYYLQIAADRPGGQPGDQVAPLVRPREILLQASYKF